MLTPPLTDDTSPLTNIEVPHHRSITGISERLGWVVIESIAEALVFMHSKKVAHLDLRPANMLISSVCNQDEKNCSINEVEENLLNGTFQLKLGDLGMSCKFDDRKSVVEGESRYCAYELLHESDHYSASSIKSINQSVSFFKPNSRDLSKADMFSFGASLYELCKGSRLASNGNDSTEWHDLRSDKFDQNVFKPYSQSFANVIQSLLQSNPNDRPSANQILSMCKQHEISKCQENFIKFDFESEFISSSENNQILALKELETDCSLDRYSIYHIFFSLNFIFK